MNVSIATIPPRIKDGSIYKSIDGFLNQTIEINKIYINLCTNFKRFDQLDEMDYKTLIEYNNKVELTFNDYDSPILKYLGPLKHIDDEEYIFIGDDDQVYNKNLLKNMKKGIFDDLSVYQNRFHIIKHGTGGIIHGFVGLMMKKKLLNKLNDFIDFKNDCWIDDQLMSIYFYKNNINIYPTIINDFDDIYEKVSNCEAEHSGAGALHKMKLKRSIQIRELEIKHNVFFLNKDSNKGKGQLKNIDSSIFNEKINIYYVILDNLTPNIKNNIDKLLNKYKENKNINFNFFSSNDFVKQYPEIRLTNDYLLNFFTDKYAIDLINNDEGHSIYINRNFKINEDFDIYKYLLENEKVFYNNEIITIIKKGFSF